jgi:hypothetical protein
MWKQAATLGLKGLPTLLFLFLPPPTPTPTFGKKGRKKTLVKDGRRGNR